jgi:glycosyltransferase involved in cell wall biosynthesis
MGRPLRFCMVTTFYPPYNFGGDGIFVRRLSHELARRGHHVEVIHCRDAYRLLHRGEPEGGYDDPPGVVVHGLESGAGPLSPLATQQTGAPLFKRRAIRRILDQGFDVIHFHNVSLVGGPGVLACGRGIKLYTPHEYWLVCPTHVLFRYHRAPCVKPHCFTCTLSYGRPPQWWRYTDLLPRSLEHLDALLAPSLFSRDVHLRAGFRVPIEHLPLFIQPPEPRPSAPPARDARGLPYFLFAGRLEKIKGLHTLLPVFRRWTRARLLVAGEGGWESHLRDMARDCPTVEFVGFRTRSQLDDLYRHAMALIVPSVNFEVGPLVALEALAHGTPVIGRNIGSISEAVTDTGAGFTYDDDAGLLKALDRLMDEPGLRSTLGERGREGFQRSWTPDAHLDRYLGLIDRIAAARERRAAGP